MAQNQDPTILVRIPLIWYYHDHVMTGNQRTMVHGHKETHENQQKTVAPSPFGPSHCSAICWLPRTEPETRKPKDLSSCRDEAAWNLARRPAPGHYLVLHDGQGRSNRCPRPYRAATARRSSCLNAMLAQNCGLIARSTVSISHSPISSRIAALWGNLES